MIDVMGAVGAAVAAEKKKVRLYLSGPMTGLPENNCPAFCAAAKDLRSRGYRVVNPGETDGGDTLKPRSYYLRKDVRALLDVDAVVVLPDWAKSRGARLEVQIANEFDLPVLWYPTLEPAASSVSGFLPRVFGKQPEFVHDSVVGSLNRVSVFPDSAAERKQRPVATGVLDYFPDALVEVAHVSWQGNEQHNPDTPVHWDRSKSTDESDALIRHFLQRGQRDTDGMRHSAKMAWRALALLQKELELECKSA